MTPPKSAPPELRRTLESGANRHEKARRVAEVIRETGGYRWVGIYEVTAEEIAVVGWNGPGAPAHPRFPVSQGLCGAAVVARATVVVGDVTKDARYLTTLGSTQSEIVVPVLDAARSAVVGLVDIESERVDAFGEDDKKFIQECASLLAPLFA
jgi:GAF domain-containing protein